MGGTGLTLLDHVLRGMVVVPFLGVPIALVGWTIFQIAVRGKPLIALLGLVAGAALCFFAFLAFLKQTYCESCADRPVSAQEMTAIAAYFGFGVVMLAVLWWTARKPSAEIGQPAKSGSDPD